MKTTNPYFGPLTLLAGDCPRRCYALCGGCISFTDWRRGAFFVVPDSLRENPLKRLGLEGYRHLRRGTLAIPDFLFSRRPFNRCGRRHSDCRRIDPYFHGTYSGHSLQRKTGFSLVYRHFVCYHRTCFSQYGRWHQFSLVCGDFALVGRTHPRGQCHRCP